MLSILISGGYAASGFKKDIWSFDSMTEVWITTNLTLGSPNKDHAVTVIDNCPGKKTKHSFQFIISDNLKVFGSESSPISRNVRSCVRASVR